MKRQVIGSGAVVCSAMVLWSQSSLPESQPAPDCEEGTASCTTTAARPAQPQPSILPPEIHWAIDRAIDWGGGGSLPDSMESVYANLLEQGQTAASESKLAIALATVSGIPTNSEHYEEASQLQESWAQELLERGNRQYQQGDVKAALSMLSAIPPTSDRFERSQELLERWGGQAKLLDRAEAARAEGDWQSVMAAIESLEGTPLYDALPVQKLLQQAIYRAYGSGDALMPLANLPDATMGTITAIPSGQTAAEGAMPNLPDLPIAVDQAMSWARPISAPSGMLPQPVPMPIAPSQVAPSQVAPLRSASSPSASSPSASSPPASSPSAIAQQAEANVLTPGSIAPPESIATVTILKTPSTSEHPGMQSDSEDQGFHKTAQP